MDDINVKEIEVLRAYCSKLNDFKTGTSAVGLLVARQIDKIKDDLKDRQRVAQQFMDFVEEKANSVISRYDYALDKCPSARGQIGETDLDCKANIRKAEDIMQSIKGKIRQLDTELENAQQHTKNFCLQVINMTDSCQNQMNRTITALEAYKETR